MKYLEVMKQLSKTLSDDYLKQVQETMEVRIVPEKLLDASVKNQEEVIHEVKAKLMEMKDGYSTDQILSIANLIDSDPMTECLVKLNRQQWDIMVDHFET